MGLKILDSSDEQLEEELRIMDCRDQEVEEHRNQFGERVRPKRRRAQEEQPRGRGIDLRLEEDEDGTYLGEQLLDDEDRPRDLQKEYPAESFTMVRGPAQPPKRKLAHDQALERHHGAWQPHQAKPSQPRRPASNANQAQSRKDYERQKEASRILDLPGSSSEEDEFDREVAAARERD
jgi:hypothetical protein